MIDWVSLNERKSDGRASNKCNYWQLKEEGRRAFYPAADGTVSGWVVFLKKFEAKIQPMVSVSFTKVG